MSVGRQGLAERPMLSDEAGLSATSWRYALIGAFAANSVARAYGSPLIGVAQVRGVSPGSVGVGALTVIGGELARHAFAGLAGSADQLAASTRSAVEAEHELVEIAGQVAGIDRAGGCLTASA